MKISVSKNQDISHHCPHEYAHKCEDESSSSYDNIYAIIDFLPIGSKHWNTNGRGVFRAKRTMLKNKPYLLTFHKCSLLVHELFS